MGRARSEVPSFITELIDRCPSDLHPMAQFSLAVTALEHESAFSKAYAKGMKKAEYWEHTFEDSMDLIAKLPTIAARIYRNVFKDGKVPAVQKDKDYWLQLGQPARIRGEHRLCRAHASLPDHPLRPRGRQRQRAHHALGWLRPLSSPMLSLAAGLNGLAGPLHGLANQEVLNWLQEMKKDVGSDLSDENITKYLWTTLKAVASFPATVTPCSARLTPATSASASSRSSTCPMTRCSSSCRKSTRSRRASLTEHGKTKNPYPNVDAHSGVLLQYYGLTEQNFYTVLFGVSRALGVLPQLIIDRAVGAPIERPKSFSTEAWAKLVGAKI